MSSSGISVKQSDSLSVLLNPQGNRLRRFFIRVFLPWLETRRLTRGLSEIVLSPEEREKQDADIAKFVENLVESLKTQGRKEASVNHKIEIEEIATIADEERSDYERELATLKDVIVKQESNHLQRLEQLNIEHQTEIKGLRDDHRQAIAKSQRLPNDFVQYLLPKITLQEGGMEFLLDSNIKPKIISELKRLSEGKIAKSETVHGTQWLELRLNRSNRMYYRRLSDAQPYLVLLGTKNSQPLDIKWMKKN